MVVAMETMKGSEVCVCVCVFPQEQMPLGVRENNYARLLKSLPQT